MAMEKWLWCQHRALDTKAEADDVLSAADTYGIDHLLVGICDDSNKYTCDSTMVNESSELVDSKHILTYMIDNAPSGTNIHAWFDCGLWSAYSQQTVGMDSTWNVNDLPGVDVDWLNFSKSGARTRVIDTIADVLTENSGVYGVHLDYIRYTTDVYGEASLSPDDVTTFIADLRTEIGTTPKISVACGEAIGENRNSQRDVFSWVDDVDVFLLMNYERTTKITQALLNRMISAGAKRIGLGISSYERNIGTKNNYYYRMARALNRLGGAVQDIAIFDAPRAFDWDEDVVFGFIDDPTPVPSGVNIVRIGGGRQDIGEALYFKEFGGSEYSVSHADLESMTYDTQGLDDSSYGLESASKFNKACPDLHINNGTNFEASAGGRSVRW